MTPEPKPTRVSTDARRAQLRDWVIAGHSPAEAYARGLQTWTIRARQLKADLDAVLSAWVEEDANEDPRRVLAVRKRQRDRLIAEAWRRLDAASDRPADAFQLMRLLDSMLRQRERLVRQIAEAGRPRASRPEEPLPPEPSAPRAKGVGLPDFPDLAAMPPEERQALEKRFNENRQAALDETRAWLKQLSPAEREAEFDRVGVPEEIRQLLRAEAESEAPAKAPASAVASSKQAPPSAAQAQRKNAKNRGPKDPWLTQVDAAPKGTFHVPLSIVGKKA